MAPPAPRTLSGKRPYVEHAEQKFLQIEGTG
jgi:hypothetical protein